MRLSITVGIVTHEVIANDREDLLRNTVASILVAFPFSKIILLDNGSWDGTDAVVKSLANDCPCIGLASSWYGDGVYGPGRGRMALQKHFFNTDADVFVCSDDDMLWKPDAEGKLSAFWAEAPEDVVLVSGLLEPEWEWNTVRGVVEAGGQRALVRDSAPGAAWTYLRRNVVEIFMEEECSMKSGEDFAACVRLRNRYRLGQMDLAEHAGWGKSTLENRADQFAMPLYKAKWGF